MIVPLPVEDFMGENFHEAVHLTQELCPDDTKYFFYGSFLIMTLFFFIMAAIGEKYHFKVGHETVFTIIFGIAFSLLLWGVAGNGCLSQNFKFSSSFFFDFMLPPLIFNSGYTMHRKKFFENLGNISIFGLGVTLVCFTIYGLGTILIIQAGPTMINYYTERQNPGETYELSISLTANQALLFAALLCSSDVVAAVSIVDYSQQPKLYSCVFGEGVFNDIISIILYGTVVSLLKSTPNGFTPFIILGEFLMLAFISLSIGCIFGFFTSYCFKHISFVRVNPIIETFLMFAFSMMSYFVSDSIRIAGLQMSGISSLLTCAIIQSHYTYYNLSP